MTKYLEACKWLYSFNNKCLRKKFGSNFFTNFTFPCHVNTLYELAEKTQWIPCSERLPNKKGYYLVTRKNPKGHVTRVKFNPEQVERGVYNSPWGNGDCDILAWMPLPEPYKGGE